MTANVRFIFTALCLLSAAASCSKQGTVPQTADAGLGGEICTCTVRLNADGVKAGSAADDSAINNFQVFVFRDDGTVDACAKAAGVVETSLKCSRGMRQIHVVANAPDMNDVENLPSLEKKLSLLADNAPQSFQMTGCSSVFRLSSDTNISVTLKHVCAKVELLKITNAISIPALAALPFEVESVYLTNVAGDINYGLDLPPQTWLSKMGFDEADTTNGLHSFIPDSPVRIAAGGSFTGLQPFYTYPNPTSDTASGKPWSPRCTRLVIKARIGTQVYYYPLNLPALSGNTAYRFNEVKITRPGSSSEDEPVETASCSVDMKIQPWETVSVNDVYEL